MGDDGVVAKFDEFDYVQGEVRPYFVPRKLVNGKYDEFHDTVIRELKNGASLRVAFVRAGVSKKQYHNWKNKLREEHEEGIENPILGPLFRDAEIAEAKACGRIMEKLQELALDGDMKAIDYSLRHVYGIHRHKDEESKQLNIDNSNVQINVVPTKKPSHLE